MKRWMLLVFLMFSLAACGEVEFKKADGVMWNIKTVQYEYRWVVVSYVPVNKVLVPIYGYRWKENGFIEATGQDMNPAPLMIDGCAMGKPENPSRGDLYCEVLPVNYYLVFGSKLAKVSESLWYKHSADKLYQTQEIMGQVFVIEE